MMLNFQLSHEGKIMLDEAYLVYETLKKSRKPHKICIIRYPLVLVELAAEMKIPIVDLLCMFLECHSYTKIKLVGVLARFSLADKATKSYEPYTTINIAISQQSDVYIALLLQMERAKHISNGTKFVIEDLISEIVTDIINLILTCIDEKTAF